MKVIYRESIRLEVFEEPVPLIQPVFKLFWDLPRVFLPNCIYSALPVFVHIFSLVVQPLPHELNIKLIKDLLKDEHHYLSHIYTTN